MHHGVAHLDARREAVRQDAAHLALQHGKQRASHPDVGFVHLEIAEKKAIASVNFGAPTHAVLGMVKGDELLMQSVNAHGSLVLLPGGFDIRADGELVGAIGIAGGHYSQDQAIGETALSATL